MADINLSQLINESLVTVEDDSAKEPGFLRRGLNRLQSFAQEHPTLTKGAKWAGGIGTVGGAAVIGKKLLDRHQANKSTLNRAKDSVSSGLNQAKKSVSSGLNQAKKSISSGLNQAKAFTGKQRKKVAAGTLAALGAGIGVKALLKYLRNKKS